MEETFHGCTSLKEGADWSVCLNLKNVTGTYEECKGLTKVPDLPAGIRIADRMCRECRELSSCPSVKKATLLESGIGMFAGCAGISSASLPPNIQIIDEMYADCINLKKMPVVPDTVTSMRGSFSGDFSLKELTNIPEKVTDISNCFSECKRADGILTIDASPNNYGGCFQGAVIGSKLIIKGNSENLEQIVLEANNRNITMDDNKEDGSDKEKEYTEERKRYRIT